ADPQRCHPSDNGCVAEVRKKHDRENTLLQIPYAGHSAISFAFAQLQAMRKAIGVDWSVRIRYFEKALELLGTIKAVNEENVAVPRSLVDMWESLREMTSTHNVVFETADDDVSAHELILLAASPVQKAMLESAMMEGSSKRIAVKDSASSGVRLFLDMVYSSSSRDEPDYKSALVALDLAHRWQVLGMVPVLAGILREMITVDSFMAIAEAAVLKELEPLQQACAAFGAKNVKIKAMLKKGPVPAPVRKLLGTSDATEAEEGQKKKKRRTFQAP
ncbi:unnamed protein product, partial [Symbiodinium pilosum]